MVTVLQVQWECGRWDTRTEVLGGPIDSQYLSRGEGSSQPPEFLADSLQAPVLAPLTPPWTFLCSSWSQAVTDELSGGQHAHGQPGSDPDTAIRQQMSRCSPLDTCSSPS